MGEDGVRAVRSWVHRFQFLAGSSIGRTSAFGAGCWRFEPSPASGGREATTRRGPGDNSRRPGCGPVVTDAVGTDAVGLNW
jgi:hypothetical protein